MTPARPRTPLAALLVALAVTCSTAGARLLIAAPEATGADAGRVPVGRVVPDDGGAGGGVGGAGAPPPDPRSLERPRPTGAGLPQPAGGEGSTQPGGTGDPARSRPGAPVRLLIGPARLRVPVVPVGDRGDGQLALPEDPGTVGWWVGSAPAGDPRGSTVLAGHVDSARAGLGALAVLRTLRVGTAIVLVDTFGTPHPYRMAARRSYPKTALPPDVLHAARIPRLVLITCGGPFDPTRHTYRDNLVVYAVPA